LKKEYDDLIGNDETKNISDHVYDICEYLMLLYKKGSLITNFKTSVKKGSLSYALSSKSQKNSTPAVDLMNLIPGLVINVIDRGCCGMAGTFGLKQKNSDISLKIGNELFEEVLKLQVDEVVTDCGMCGVQIMQGTGKEVVHPIEIIYEACK